MSWNTLAWEENRTKEEDKIPGKDPQAKHLQDAVFWALGVRFLTSTF